MDISKEIELGKEADLKFAFVDGKIRVEVKYEGLGGDAGAFFDLKPDYFLDQLKGIIPGKVDDTLIDLLKGAFK